MTKQKKRLINLLTALKGIILVAGSSAYVMDYPNITFWVLISGAALDQAIQFINKDIKLENENN